ncbi:alpha/beta fold hydrolase [Bordetella trematum]|uniref:alpha/beta fold hydrolase n=1 Tax=Bordetella trematum TaxID=123899 RepID=UPI0004724567|nr:alpha/beta hydrolase [Bordetella trematum]
MTILSTARSLPGLNNPGLTAFAPRQYIDVLGIRTAFHRARPSEAARATVVLLHGGAPGACAELNWFRNLPALVAAGYDVIAYDQPGFGYSAAPADAGIDFRYCHLEALLQALAPEEVHLIGNSIGGLLCCLYALRQPAGPTVRSLTLAAPYPYFDPPARAKARLQAHRNRLATVSPTFESIRALCLNTFNQPDCVTDGIVQLRLDMLSGARWDAYAARSGASREFNRADIAGRMIDVPTLLIWGVEDCSLPHEIGIEAMRHFRHGQYLFLNQCGHWPQTEQAAVFNRQTIDFLDAQYA